MSNNEVLDDTSTLIIYNPENAWKQDSTLGAYQPFQGTVSGTTQVNATASLNFTGTSISVNCLVLLTGSNFTATLDGTLLGTYNTAVAALSSEGSKTMFTKSGLNGNAQHTLVLQKIADVEGWVSSLSGDPLSHLNLDSFTIVGGTAISPASTSSSSPPSSSLPAGAIAGIVVGVIALILGVGAFLWYHRRKARRVKAAGHTPFVDPTQQTIETKQDQHDVPPSPVSTAAASAPQPRVRSGPREKVGLPFINQNEGPGSNSRRRWRSSLFELPGHRVVRAQSRMAPPRPVSSEGETDLVASTVASNNGAAGDHTAIRFASPPPLSMNANTSSPSAGSRVQPRDRASTAVPETLFSPISGPESHITESTNPPSSVPDTLPPLPEASTSSPSSSPRIENIRDREKASFQGPHSGTATSLPLSASTVPAPSSSSPSSASEVPAHVLLRELAGLRDQVRHLTELHHGGGGIYSAGETDPHEPPPEYVGRDSDEESEV